MSVFLARYGGLIVPIVVWAVNTQLSQILPYGDCETRSAWTLIAAIAATGVATAAALAGIVYSWTLEERPTPIVTYALGLAGLGFAFALSLQTAGSFVVDACAR